MFLSLPCGEKMQILTSDLHLDVITGLHKSIKLNEEFVVEIIFKTSKISGKSNFTSFVQKSMISFELKLLLVPSVKSSCCISIHFLNVRFIHCAQSTSITVADLGSFQKLQY